MLKSSRSTSAQNSQSPTNIGVIIMAAGQGKRMRSSLPKVLHEMGGQPLLFHVLDRVQEAAPQATIAIVVGHGREQVESIVRATPKYKDLKIAFCHQPEQRGTGDAARAAMDSPWGQTALANKMGVLVLPGDLPLIPTSLVSQMIEPLGRTEALRLLTSVLPDPAGYGRIVRRGKKGPVLRIVEEKDANLREKQIHEVGASIYFFQSPFLNYGLQRLSNKNAQQEFYLTDLIAQAARSKKKTEVLTWSAHEDLRGVNDPWELATARRILNQTCIRAWALQGVRFIDPATTWLDVSVTLEADVTIHPGVSLSGSTHVEKGASIGAHAHLKDTRVGAEANIKTGTVAEKAQIGANCQVGPYAHLRPESVIGSDSKIGNFVELKKTVIGSHTSIAHLSYLGDAQVGNHVNIGCGFVTCNYDGMKKHRTVIEDEVFLGSDCQAVAPIKVGKGAYVASGSTITEDVEAGALAIARARQVNKLGYAKKLKSK